MSQQKNYSKFSNKLKENKDGQMYLKDVVKIVEPAGQINDKIVEAPVQTTINQKVDRVEVYGFVDGCDRMYVRKKPSKDSEHICIIEKSTKLYIDLNASNAYFYKVRTLDGIEGYCMKQFISIK